MEEYLRLLMDQFVEATGTKNPDPKSKLFLEEFSDWVKERQKISSYYLELLRHIEGDIGSINNPKTIEVGKGKHDSSVKRLRTTIITPYTEGLTDLKNKQVIEGNLTVVDKKALLVKNIDKMTYYADSVIPEITLMTQNPYTPARIKNWESLHNSNRNQIVVGIYGSIHDKDRGAKAKQLEAFISRLDEPFVQQQMLVYDTYSWVVASEHKGKRLIKKK